MLQPGDVFVELSFFAKRPRTTNIMIETDYIVLRLEIKIFEVLRSVYQIQIEGSVHADFDRPLGPNERFGFEVINRTGGSIRESRYLKT